MIYTEAIITDEEINQYWSMLTIPQKESLVTLIKSFINSEDVQRISIELSQMPLCMRLINTINNDGRYRAFEKHHYRVMYKIHPNALVLTIRHSKQDPHFY